MGDKGADFDDSGELRGTPLASGSEVDSLVRQVSDAPSVALETHVGRTIGRYRILRVLGQGGMGRVYEAEDLELGRRVAIKFLRAALSLRDGHRQRFLRERSVTAELEHPGIVPVYDSGVSLEGEPFYVMRIARGEPLDRLIERASTRAARMALLPNVIAAADAVAFAHSHGFVHRDLKPSNVLVGAFGETLVADWGLAKRIRGTEEPVVGDATSIVLPTETAAGAVVGTPAYMAPEQAQGLPVDERADIYALGALLEHVLAGRPPRVGERWTPPAPRREGDSLTDLIAIARKATADSPADRYERAEHLVEELRRAQAGQIVEARVYTWLELLRRWARRHRAQLVLAGVLLSVLLAVVIVGLVRIVRERNGAITERTAAEQARRETVQRNNELVLLQARAELSRDPTASLAWLKHYPDDVGDWATALGIASDAWSRGVARHVWNMDRSAGSVAFSSDDRLVGAGLEDGTLALIDVETGARRLLHAPDGVGDRIVFSPDGKVAVTSDVHMAGRVWDLASGTSLSIGGGTDLRFSSDGAWLVVRSGLPLVVRKMPGGEPAPLPGKREPDEAAFVPRSHTLAMRFDNDVLLYDLDGGRTLAHTHVDGAPRTLGVTGDGRTVVVGGGDVLVLWDPASGALRKIPIAVPAAQTVLALSPDGRWVASCGNTTTEVWLFDLHAGTGRRLSTGERCTYQAFQFSPDSSLLVTAALGDELRLHEVAAGTQHLLRGHESAVLDAGFSADGRWLVSAGSDGEVRLWRIGEGDVRVLHEASAMSRISADGKMLVDDERTGVQLVDVATGARRLLDGSPTRPARASGDLSAHGNVAVERADDGTHTVWDLQADTTRTLGGEARAGYPGPRAADALSSDGAWLVQNDGAAVRAVDMASGRAHDVAKITNAIFAVTISDDERSVAAGGRSGTATVWDRETGEQRGAVPVGGWVWDVAFSPDASRLAVAATDGVLRLLTLSTGRIEELRGHVGTVASANFSPDGRRVVSAGSDGTVRLWDVASGRGLIVRREPTGLFGAAYSADGSLMDLLSPKKVRIWDARVLPPLEPDAGKIKSWIEQVTTATVDERGRLRSP